MSTDREEHMLFQKVDWKISKKKNFFFYSSTDREEHMLLQKVD
jgi:hypothetical protein